MNSAPVKVNLSEHSNRPLTGKTNLNGVKGPFFIWPAFFL
jgi:hypothetical protein